MSLKEGEIYRAIPILDSNGNIVLVNGMEVWVTNCVNKILPIGGKRTLRESREIFLNEWPDNKAPAEFVGKYTPNVSRGEHVYLGRDPVDVYVARPCLHNTGCRHNYFDYNLQSFVFGTMPLINRFCLGEVCDPDNPCIPVKPPDDVHFSTTAIGNPIRVRGEDKDREVHSTNCNPCTICPSCPMEPGIYEVEFPNVDRSNEGSVCFEPIHCPSQQCEAIIDHNPNPGSANPNTTDDGDIGSQNAFRTRCSSMSGSKWCIPISSRLVQRECSNELGEAHNICWPEDCGPPPCDDDSCITRGSDARWRSYGFPAYCDRRGFPSLSECRSVNRAPFHCNSTSIRCWYYTTSYTAGNVRGISEDLGNPYNSCSIRLTIRQSSGVPHFRLYGGAVYAIAPDKWKRGINQRNELMKIGSIEDECLCYWGEKAYLTLISTRLPP